MLFLLYFYTLICFSVFTSPFFLMACSEMYNKTHPSSQHSQPPPMSPRISFSNDFVESQNSHNLLTTSRLPPPSSDFEFSVPNHNMLNADELFFKGRLLPFKDNSGGNNGQIQRTLRDELLVDDEIDFSLKPPKSSSSNRWKGFLGLRKSHIGSKKPEKSGSFDDSKKFAFSPDDASFAISPQDMMSSGGPSSTDVEMGI